MEKTQREHGLDFVKIIATLLIVLHHYWQVQNVHIDNFINFYGGKFYFGYIVELFFVLSGFFMLGSIKRISDGQPFREYFVKKYLRFQPLIMLSVIAFAILTKVFEALYEMPWGDVQVSLWGIISASLAIQEGWGIPNPSLNNPLWYISVLLLCYVILYLIVRISKKLNMPVTRLAVFMILLGIGIMTYGINLPFLNGMTSRGFYSFFWGVLLANVMENHQPNRAVRIISMLILIGFPFLIAYTDSFMAIGMNYNMTFVYYTAVVIVFTSDTARKIFGANLWETLAAISYNAYIWHSCVFTMAAIYFFTFNIVPDFAKPITILAMVAAVFAVGAFSHLFIDKPTGMYLSKRINRFLTGNGGENSDPV